MSAPKLGMSGNLTTTKHFGSAQKKAKAMRVRHFGIPGLGRIAFTRDQGEANLFSEHFLGTNLHVTMRDPSGYVLLDENLGSGLVTNVGVLALASIDIEKAIAKAKEPFNTFALARWHAWGTKATAAAATDVKLGTYAKPTETECVEGTNTLGTANGAGEPKLLSTGTIKAESTLKIVEWGLHTSKLLSKGYGTAEKFESVTVSSAKIAAANEFPESTSEARGIVNEILLATEAEEIWGLVTKNTKTVATVPAFYKQSTGAEKAPSGTSLFKVRPVLWDHKEFGQIEVESGNEITFKYELTVKSGG